MAAPVTMESPHAIGRSVALRFKTFGQVFLERDGVRVAGAAAQPRRLALLAILAAAGHRGVSRERLLALLWTDTDEERARKGLNQALYALRHEIGSDDSITGTRDLVLAPELVHTDVSEFRLALGAGDIERAISVYEGQFLDGFHLPGSAGFERWMEGERANFARDHAAALEKLARRAEERSDHAGAVEWWRRLASLDPLDGKTTLRLMEALVRAGDRVSALKQSRIYEVLLSQELELPPDRDVIALAERIRAMESSPVAFPAVTVANSGAPAQASSPLPGAVESVTANAAAPVVSEAEPAAAAPQLSLPVTAAAAATLSAEVAAPGHAAPVSPLPGQPVAKPMRHRWPTARWIAGGGLALAVVGAVTAREWRAEHVPTLGATRRITLDAGLEVDPVLAPDGRTLAYAAGPEGAMRIYVRRRDGGRAVPVSGELPGDHRRPRWSPDGSRLLFQAGGGIWLVPALGGVPRAVVPALPTAAVRALYPEWSPDGRSLAWVRRDSVMTRALDGGTDRVVGTLPEAHSLAWSPDGRWIAAVSGNEGFAYGAAASTMDVGFSSIGNVAPSSVWLVPVDGGEPVRVVAGDHLNTSPAWLAANRLLFVSDRDGTRDLFVIPLHDAGDPDGAPRRLTTGLDAHTVSVQRDGRALAYSVFAQRSNVWALAIPAGGAVGTAAATPVTTSSQIVEAMEVSPDGKWLAFDADGAESQDIYRVPLRGGDPELVVERPTDDHRPTWSPDGRSLLFYSFVDGVRRAFVAPSHGGAARMLQPGGRDEQHTPVWSPDMRRVVFHRPVGVGGVAGVDQIFEITKTNDSTWSAPVQLTRRGGFGGRWSPDGSQLAYVAPRQVRLMGEAPDREATSRVLYDAGDTTSGKPNPVAIRWSPDGRLVYMKTFDARGQAALWSLGLAGGPPRLLVRFDEPLRPTRRPEFATDGNRLYFTLAQSESDVWVMDIARR